MALIRDSNATNLPLGHKSAEITESDSLCEIPMQRAMVVVFTVLDWRYVLMILFRAGTYQRGNWPL